MGWDVILGGDFFQFWPLSQQMHTNLLRVFYLLVFLAPVSFLLGYIAGAPRTTAREYHMPPVDKEILPVSPIDFYRNENSLVVETKPWIQPNSEFVRR
jgi:hypothetical protein